MDLIEQLAQALGFGPVDGTNHGIPTVPSMDPRQAAIMSALQRPDVRQLSLGAPLLNDQGPNLGLQDPRSQQLMASPQMGDMLSQLMHIQQMGRGQDVRR